jgi:hypothetical protein
LTDQELIEKAKGAADGEKFARLMAGDTGGYGSASEADLAFCGQLVFWCQGDRQRIDALFRQSGLMRPKWDERRGEKTYGQRTIDKALEGKSEFYQPGGNGHKASNNTVGGEPAAADPTIETAREWQDPIPVPDVPPAPFPLEALPRSLRDYVMAVAASKPCPVDLVAVAALAAASAAIGNARHLRVKAGWTEGPRLWCAIVCDPGSKKSPALAAATRPIKDEQRRLKQRYQEEMEEHNRKVADWKADKREDKGNKPDEPKMRQVFAADTTREGLAVLLEDNPRGLALIRDELTGWATGLNQYKQGKGDDRQFWLALWSGCEVLVNRASSRGKPAAYVTDPTLSVVGCLPPTVLGQLQDEEGREDGFVHRLLFSWPQRVPLHWSEVEPHPDAVKEYDRLFERLFQLDMPPDEDTGEPAPRRIGWTKEGKQVWVRHVEHIAAELNGDDLPENLHGPWAKLEGYGARLALVLHVCRFVMGETRSEDVDEVSMRGAALLVEYFQAHAQRVYPRLLSTSGDKLRKDAQAVLEWIDRNRARIEPADGATGKPALTFTWRMVRHDLHSRFEDREEDLTKALKALEGRDYLQEVHRERKGVAGRLPKPDYLVNPKTWCRNAQNARNGPKEAPKGAF